MHVQVDDDGDARLFEVDDFKSFKLVAGRTVDTLPQLRQSLSGVVGKMDDRHAWVRQAWLRTENGSPRPAAWQQQFGELLAYAGSKGWIDTESGDVRAHIEWQTPSGA